MHFTLCDYMLEIVQNAVESGADSIAARCEQMPGSCRFVVEDNGRGMSKDELRACLDPFCTDPAKHAGRRVGLGLSFLSQLLEETGGTLNLHSEPGRGTRVEANFDLEHVDTPPPGDFAEWLVAAMSFEGEYDLKVEHAARSCAAEPWQAYALTRAELREALGDLGDIAALLALRRFARQQEARLRLPKPSYGSK